jgi:hypothetical protein
MQIVCTCYLSAPGCTTYFNSGFRNPPSYVDHPGGGLGAPGVEPLHAVIHQNSPGADGGPTLGPPLTAAEFFRGAHVWGWGWNFITL